MQTQSQVAYFSEQPFKSAEASRFLPPHLHNHYATLCKRFMQHYATFYNITQQYATLCNIMLDKNALSTKQEGKLPHHCLLLDRVDRGAGCDDATETSSMTKVGTRTTGCDKDFFPGIP